MRRSLIIEVAEHYTGGKSPGVETAEGLSTAAKALADRLDKGKIKPEEIHMGQLFESFVNFPGSKLRKKWGQLAGNVADNNQDIIEAITSSEFPFITGKLIQQTLIPEYERNIENLSLLLTEDDASPATKTMDIAGTMGVEEPDSLLEGEEYQLTTDREKTVQLRAYKFGRRLAGTRELVTFDQTGGAILQRARNAGETMGNHRFTWVIQGVQDIAITATGQAANTVFKYDGSTAALYANSHTGVDNQTNDNLITTPLSTTGLRDMFVVLGKMVDYYGKDLRLNLRGPNIVLLVPLTLEVEARKLVTSTGDPDSANRGENVFRNAFSVMSDPGLEANSSSNWYFGNFKRQFIWKWIWRPSVRDIPGDPRRDIVVEYVYGYYAAFGAQDYRFAGKSSA